MLLYRRSGSTQPHVLDVARFALPPLLDEHESGGQVRVPREKSGLWPSSLVSASLAWRLARPRRGSVTLIMSSPEVQSTSPSMPTMRARASTVSVSPSSLPSVSPLRIPRSCRCRSSTFPSTTFSSGRSERPASSGTSRLKVVESTSPLWYRVMVLGSENRLRDWTFQV